MSRICQGQRGGVIITVVISLFVLVAILALATETFRLLTSRLQMQNIAEYCAEVALNVIRTSPAGAETAIKGKIVPVLNNNKFLGQSSSSGSDIGSADISFNAVSSTSSVVVLVGCFDPRDGFKVFTCMATPTCAGNEKLASYVQFRTVDGKKEFAGIMTQIFNVTHLMLKTSALSYYSNSIFLTGPFREADWSFAGC